MQNERNELSKIVRSLPQTSGVYLMKDRLGQVIYVGKAKNLKRRVSSYFQGSRRFIRAQPKIAAMVEMVREISVHQTRNETEALLLEGKLIKQYKPRYNTDFTDDKQFLLVQVDLQNKLPRFRLCRNRKEDGSHYYGPFAQAGMLRATLAEMRKRFGILLADAKPEVLSGDRVRLYHDARAEIFAGHNETTLDEYRERVDRACSFLEGRTKELLKELREEMTKCAEAMDFERAAHLRDLSEALAKTIRKTRRFVRHWPKGDDLEQEDFVCFGDRSLAEVIFRELRSLNQTLAVAESCTGGLLSASFTEIPGISKVFHGGAVCYHNDAKVQILEVPEIMLEQHGAVSEEIAIAMATSACEKFGTDYGLSITGFAGPTGGTQIMPIGSIYLGYASPLGVWAKKINLRGDRASNRRRATSAALDWMRRKLRKYKIEEVFAAAEAGNIEL
jgi:PncC family amidohydrolase